MRIALVSIILLFPLAERASAQASPFRIEADSEVREHSYGIQLAVHEGTVLVGSTGDSSQSRYGGAIEVLTFIGEAWHRSQVIYPSVSADHDGFGRDFDLSEDLLFVKTGSSRGGSGLFIFENAKGSWQEIQRIQLPEEEALISGFTVFAADSSVFLHLRPPQASGIDGSAVMVFRPDNGQWAPTERLQPNPDVNDNFGHHICKSDDLLVIGAGRATLNEIESGVVYIYTLDGDSWTLTQQIVPTNAEISDQFGRGIACFDDRIVVHSYSREHAYSFIRTGDEFIEAGRIDLPDQAHNSETVQALGDTLVISGSEFVSTGNGTKTYTTLHFFEQSGDNWSLVRSQMTPRPLEEWEVDDGWFGWSIADGDGVRAISAPYRDRMTLDEMGEVFIWGQPNTSSSSERHRFSESTAPAHFPNPSDGVLTMVQASGAQHSQYRVYDSLGRSLAQGKIDGRRQTLDLRRFGAGAYLIVLCDERGSCSSVLHTVAR